MGFAIEIQSVAHREYLRGKPALAVVWGEGFDERHLDLFLATLTSFELLVQSTIARTNSIVPWSTLAATPRVGSQVALLAA